MSIQQIRKWGNSLAIRIPASLANDLHLAENADVEVSAQDGALIIKPTSEKVFSLQRYLDQLQAGKLEIAPTEDWGSPQGSEAGGPDDPARHDEW